MDRVWQVDFARGVAIVMMIAANFVTDLQFFYGYKENASAWATFSLLTAFLFVFIAGISVVLSRERAGKEHNFFKFFKRGAWIFALGMLITVVTFLFIPQDFVRWGVLHLIGASVILAYPFLGKKARWSAAVGVAIIVVGLFIGGIASSSNSLLVLGLKTADFRAVDYFPIFPWLGVALLGVALGKKLSLKSDVGPRAAKPVSWLGRHSLAIYLVHQPLLLGLLFALNGIPGSLLH